MHYSACMHGCINSDIFSLSIRYVLRSNIQSADLDQNSERE